MGNPRIKNNLFLSRLFSFAFDRHVTNCHNADYEVCRHWLCRAAWFVEKWLWYGGAVGDNQGS